MGGYAPEKMGNSSIFIKYLIKSDGSIIIPNTTPNSLADNQDTFINGERISIHSANLSTNSTTAGSGEDNIRTVVRGGKRIEPILYNQIGHSPPSWQTESINLLDINGGYIPVNNYQAALNPLAFVNYGGFWGFNELALDNIISNGLSANLTSIPLPVYYLPIANTYRLEIDQNMIDDGMSFNFSGLLSIETQPYNPSTSIYIQIFNVTTATSIGLSNPYFVPEDTTGGIKTFNYLFDATQIINGTNTIQSTDLVLGDEYAFRISFNYSTPQTGDDVKVKFGSNATSFNINQSPAEGEVSIPIPGLWGSGSGLPWEYTITSSNVELVSYFTSNNVSQEDIPNSGFFDISIPWSILPGDEFRFEGREDRVFLVKQAYISNSELIVEVDKPLLPSGSMNLDQFAIRRYVDEAAAVVITGLKPQGSSGPYIIKPEYLSKEIDKDIDSYIQNLTEKGLI